MAKFKSGKKTLDFLIYNTYQEKKKTKNKNKKITLEFSIGELLEINSALNRQSINISDLLKQPYNERDKNILRDSKKTVDSLIEDLAKIGI